MTSNINNFRFTYGGQEYSCYIEGIDGYLDNPVYEIMVNFRDGAAIYTKYHFLGISYDTIALLNDD